MPVYVDQLRPSIPSSYWRYTESCHLYVMDDSLGVLHKFAGEIGLRRGWFQNHDIMPHYDLTRARRSVAISHGAISVDKYEWLAHYRRERTRKLGDKLA